MEYTAEMNDRGKVMLIMAKEVCNWNSVTDIGCGNQQLRKEVNKINPDATYTGVDRLNHHKDTILADFNKGEFPKIFSDLVVVSGVFEYINPKMVDTFIKNVCKTADLVAFSYWPTDYYSRIVYKPTGHTRSRPKVWLNHFKLADVLGFFNDQGFIINSMQKYESSSQYMMIFVKKK